MNKQEQSCLIDFFESIRKFPYVVLRNAAELPMENTSNDIDILIDPVALSRFRTTMFQIMRSHGFLRMERSFFHGIECYTFFSVDQEETASLKIDLFCHFEGGGVKYLDFNDIYAFRQDNGNHISVLAPDMETILTATKVFAAGGMLKPRYLEPFERQMNFSAAIETVNKLPSRTLRQKIHSVIQNPQANNKPLRRSKVAVEAWLSNFCHSPLATAGRTIRHLTLELSRLWNNRRMVVFVGPDGAGKSALIDYLLDHSKPLLRSPKDRFFLFHHRPHLICNMKQIIHRNMTEQEVDELNFCPHSGKQSGFLVSLIKLFYYGFDYRMGYLLKIWPHFRRSKIVIFDRYFYDFMVDQQRSAVKLPQWLVRMFYWSIIPRPDRVFFIQVDAKEAHRRKQELPEESIQKINDAYAVLMHRFPYFVGVPNINLASAQHEITKQMILAITIPVQEA